MLNASHIFPFINHITDELAAIIRFDRRSFASDRHDVVLNPNYNFDNLNFYQRVYPDFPR